MRRITLTIVSTVAILVLLFAYKTSRNESVGTAAVTAGDANTGAHIISAATPSAGATANPSTGGNTITVPSTTSDPTTAGSSDGSSPEPNAPSTSAATTSSNTSTSSTATTSSSTSAAGPVVVAGDSINTRYGPVQVQVTITNGKITDVTTPVYPQEDRRDQEINSQAIPVLQQEVLAAQGYQIDAVSGATFTSDGFIGSLQSALDAAHFGQ